MPVITHKNIVVNYEIQGRGPTVVLLHGFLEDLSMWQNITPSLAVNHKVISIDLLGHGHTDSLGYVHRMEDQAEIVKAVLTELEIKEYRIVGHSMGGYVGLVLAKKFPEEVKGLCLMNSTAFPDTPDKKINRDRAIEALKQNHKSFVRIAIPGLFAPWNRERFKKEIESSTSVALQMRTQGIIAALEGMKIREDRTDVLEMSTLQNMLIIGKADPALDLDSLLVQSRIGGVRSITFDDGHMSHIENEAELIKALQEFVKHPDKR